ncbi:MAG: hypothetical protein ACP5UV_01665 [Thermoplasmata archaeon]
MSEKVYGNMALGSFIGIVSILMLAPDSFLGWFAGGIISGLISRGASRGVLSSLISSLFVLIVIVFLLIISGQTLLSNVYTIFGPGYVYSLISYVENLSNLSVSFMTLRFIIEGIFPALVGGVIGGSLARHSSS